jgi:hypothetical protein
VRLLLDAFVAAGVGDAQGVVAARAGGGLVDVVVWDVAVRGIEDLREALFCCGHNGKEKKTSSRLLLIVQDIRTCNVMMQRKKQVADFC